jgi:hypothetical protein
MPGEPPKNPQILSCLNIYPANLFRLAYSRNKHLRTNTIGIVNVHILNMQWESGLVLLAKTRSASPIRRDNAYL